MFQIALDGPPGSGKSTLGKALAKRLGILYLDSGALYRAYALHLLNEKVNLEDNQAIEAEMEEFDFHFEGSRALLSGIDVSEALREQRVSETIRFIGANPKIRAFLTGLMQKLSEGCSVVMDGRDVASTILPGAQFKYFVICNLEERAKRRYLELKEKGVDTSYEEVRRAISEREEIERTRKHAPVVRHPESKLIDSSLRTTEELVEELVNDIRESGIDL